MPPVCRSAKGVLCPPVRCVSRRHTSTLSYTRCAAHIAEKNDGAGGINAFVAVQLDSLDARPHSGALNSLPIAVKDNICTASFPTTCSSSMLSDFNPEYDATVVRLLREEGAAVIGKTNCDEFGMGSLNTHTVHGPVVNPFQPSKNTQPWRRREQRSAGGSSGGSAAAVASSMCFAALSTDTGGSTRLPAAYCGVVGLKPSYGLISRWGVVAFADSLDCVGIMASKVERVRQVFDVVAKFDPKDPTSAPEDVREETRHLYAERLDALRKGKGVVQGLRIGIPQEYFPQELNPSILIPFRRLLKGLTSRGATIVPISLPSTQYALSCYYVLASTEASSNLARYDGVRYGTRVKPTEKKTSATSIAGVYAPTRSAGFGSEVRRRILLGSYALTADAFDNYFLQAQRVRLLVRRDFDEAFRVSNPLYTDASHSSNEDGVDVILHPSSILSAPPLLAGTSAASSSIDDYVQDMLTVPASLAGIPALNVPIAGEGEGAWPVGVSVVGQWGSDEFVLEVGNALEDIESSPNS